MSAPKVAKLLCNAECAEKRLSDIKTKLEQVTKLKVQEKVQQLTKQNIVLKAKVLEALNELVKLETSRGVKQYSIPSKSGVTNTLGTAGIDVTKEEKPAKIKKENPQSDKKPKAATTSDTIVDVRKLDFRIGKIIEINKHPNADSLYVEKIDCGEENARTVVSGLVNHVPIEEMRDRIVMVLCNLKPVKMRGVTSEAMVMCASSPDKVEVLIPPTGAFPGDLVICEGYPREPEAQLNPKKKIFETCAPDLKTNNDRVACYKDSPLVVEGKGPITAASLTCVSVK